MRGQSDQWVENRILHKLFVGADELPGVYVFSKRNHQIPSEVSDVLASKPEVGIPVFAVIESPNCFTVIATNMVVGKYKGVLSVFEIDEIAGFSVPQKNTLCKDELQLLEITTYGGAKCVIWSPPSVFGGIYGVLLMLQRMQKHYGSSTESEITQ